jgi:hypothetical protein
MRVKKKKGGTGKGIWMENEEREVRESSLSYVIGSMNNDSTRKSGDNDPCGQGMGATQYGIARYVMGRRRRCADTLAVVRVYQASRSAARPDGTSDLIWGSLVRRTLLGFML